MEISQILQIIRPTSFISTLVFFLFSIGSEEYISGHAGPPSIEAWKRSRLYSKISLVVFFMTLILGGVIVE